MALFMTLIQCLIVHAMIYPRLTPGMLAKVDELLARRLAHKKARQFAKADELQDELWETLWVCGSTTAHGAGFGCPKMTTMATARHVGEKGCGCVYVNSVHM